jgi:uncharacterized protein involved in exopolysaccharide biosynthesis
MNSADEISLQQIFEIFSKRWKYLFVLALVFLLSALVKHKYFPSYPGTGKLIIKDVKNSQLQSVIGHAAGPGTELSFSETKGDDLATRAETLLDVHDFYYRVAERLLYLRHIDQNKAVETFFKKYTLSESDPEFLHLVANDLASILTFVPAKSDVLLVNSKSSNRELSVILVNETLKEAQSNLVKSELEDLNRAENYFKLEIENVRSKLDNIEDATVKKMQRNQVLPTDMEKNESAKYIGELRKSINTTQMAITNNQGKIQELKKNSQASRFLNVGLISKFNESSQMRILEDENKELALQLKTFQSYLQNFEKQKNGLVPFQYELEKMNANHDFEYKMYASLNDSLARIGLQKTYVKNKVEILELERNSNVRSSPTIIILILIALMVSQVIGIFSIYSYELFKSVT